MASLKYKDSNGQFKTIVGYTVKNDVVQTTGSSTTSVMSQSAVTEIIEDITPESLGNGIGTCETSAETLAKEVDIEGYKITQNGFVSITFENDVPSGATLNINNQGAKPIYHKGAPIEDDVISSGDTVMFGYDGSHYVVSSLGGGSTSVGVETININLVQVYGYDADLIGTTVTVTDLDTSTVLLSTTWQGSTITLDIEAVTSYKVEVEDVVGYLTPSYEQHIARLGRTLNLVFQYRCTGVFIEATDGTLYRSSEWANANKVANSLVILSDKKCFRVGLEYKQSWDFSSSRYDGTDPQYFITNVMPSNTNDQITIPTILLNDFNGKSYTFQLYNYLVHIVGTSSGNYLPLWVNGYTFPDGSKDAFIPSVGYANIIANYSTEIDNCFTTLGLTAPTWYESNNGLITSSYAGKPYGRYGFWFIYGANVIRNYNYTSPYTLCFVVKDL